MKPLLTTRLCIFALSSLATIGTLIVGALESSFALDPLPRSPRVGSWQIPLGSYERIPSGRNTSGVRAPMLTAGDHVDLLVRVYDTTETDGLGGSLEVFALWIERAQD
jgi:hypothetical protein